MPEAFHSRDLLPFDPRRGADLLKGRRMRKSETVKRPDASFNTQEAIMRVGSLTCGSGVFSSKRLFSVSNRKQPQEGQRQHWATLPQQNRLRVTFRSDRAGHGDPTTRANSSRSVPERFSDLDQGRCRILSTSTGTFAPVVVASLVGPEPITSRTHGRNYQDAATNWPTRCSPGTRNMPDYTDRLGQRSRADGRTTSGRRKDHGEPAKDQPAAFGIYRGD